MPLVLPDTIGRVTWLISYGKVQHTFYVFVRPSFPFIGSHFLQLRYALINIMGFTACQNVIASLERAIVYLVPACRKDAWLAG